MKESSHKELLGQDREEEGQKMVHINYSIYPKKSLNHLFHNSKVIFTQPSKTFSQDSSKNSLNYNFVVIPIRKVNLKKNLPLLIRQKRIFLLKKVRSMIVSKNFRLSFSIMKIITKS